MSEEIEFQPDWVSAPGETIADILNERALSLADFARHIGHTLAHAEELLSGRAPLTMEIARQLESALGASAAFWITRESQYREDLARLQHFACAETDVNWLREIPLKEMTKFGWIESASGLADQAAACLRFFGVQDVRAWRKAYANLLETATFRTSPSLESLPGAVAAWLRQGEIMSASIECKPWIPKVFKNLLPSIRGLTRQKNPSIFIPELTKRCAECGVAVVILRTPSGCRASGATRFLSAERALLLLSFRYLSEDHFWFTFFHEAGHLLLHSKDALFLEGAEMAPTKEEEEANRFAARVLIPSEFQAALLSLGLDAHEIMRFARLVGVSPGIVVGQLQHLDRIKHHQLNSLKRRFRWRNH
jgi:plasmid maintenance system antidote protein VapI